MNAWPQFESGFVREDGDVCECSTDAYATCVQANDNRLCMMGSYVDSLPGTLGINRGHVDAGDVESYEGRTKQSPNHHSVRPLPRRVRALTREHAVDHGDCAEGIELHASAKHERTLPEGERRFRQLAESAQDVIYRYRLHPDRGFEYVNPAALAVSGYTPQEHYDDPDLGLKIVHPDDRGLLNSLLAGPTHEKPVQLRWIRKDGTIIWTEQVNVRIRDEEGTIVGLEGIARDITKRKESEDELRRMNSLLGTLVEQRTAELSSANKELELVLYSLAHDLRAPLRHLEGYLSLLRSDLDGQDATTAATEHVSRLESIAARMNGQFDALLSFSRIGHQEMHRTSISMNSLVDEVKHQLEAASAPGHIEWNIGNLPPVCGDPSMMYSVLFNLLGNAVKFSRRHIPSKISMHGFVAGNELHYVVRDNGAGFDSGQQERLFGLFQRLHTREEYEGHGIGLALVRRIVELHGGWIQAESTQGEGATFTFSLPARQLDTLQEQDSKDISDRNMM